MPSLNHIKSRIKPSEGFQRVHNPLVRSRVTPHRVGRCRNATEGTDPIRGTALVGHGAKPHNDKALRKR